MIIKIFFKFVSFFIPINKKIWVFGSWYGDKYGDNPKALYEYISSNNKEITSYWVTKNKKIYEQLNNDNRNVLFKGTLKFYYIMLRSSVFICNCSHDKDTFSSYANNKATFINLWHGTPIKKIGYDAKSYEGLRNKFFSFFKKNIYFGSPSNYLDNIFKSAFLLNDESIIRTGYCKLEFVNRNKLLEDKILFAPTYRGQYNSILDDLSYFELTVDRILEIVEKTNCKFVIRLHPANKLSKELITELEKYSEIEIDYSDDLYDLLGSYKYVITDYSSLFFDSVTLSIPTIIAPIGLDSYTKNDRELYIDLDHEFSAITRKNWTEITDLIISLNYVQWDELLTPIRTKYHSATTVGSCQTLILEIKKLINYK